MSGLLLDKLRSIALALPGVEEKVSHRAPCFYVRKSAFCRFHDTEFGVDDRVVLWCRSSAEAVEDLAVSEPSRFFKPTPSAGGVFANWLGVYLDTAGDAAVEWGEVSAIVVAGYRLVAPKGLAVELDERFDN